MLEHAGSIRQSWFHGITRETYNLLGDPVLWAWMIMNRDHWPGCQSLCHKSSIGWATVFYFDVARCYVAVVKLAKDYCRMMSCHRKLDFLHDRSWILPLVKSISNEYHLSRVRITMVWWLWCHRQSIVTSPAECKVSEWDMGMMCEDPCFSVIFGFVMSCKK